MSNYGDTTPSLELSKPLSVRVIENKTTRMGHQTESLAQIEVVGGNGVKHMTDVMLRTVEIGNTMSKVTTVRRRKFASKDDTIPAQSSVETFFTDIAKGEVEGDYQWATYESTMVTDAGIQKIPTRWIKQPLLCPNTERSDREMMEAIITMVTDMWSEQH